MAKLFGTDGIRGVANQHPMTIEVGVQIGRAVARLFTRKSGAAKILLGRDTRLSGPMIQAALAAGICSMGTDAVGAGIIPTPAVAALTRMRKADAGIMVSASHNPFYDNGIKIFQPDGYKLTDAQEAQIEDWVLNGDSSKLCRNIRETGHISTCNDAYAHYLEFLLGTQPRLSLQGLRVVLDCAHGATYRIAPQLFERLGADVSVMAAAPDGKNINEDCGSEHPLHLQSMVREKGAHLGLAFDGDGDRVIAVDEKGQLVTGDQMLAVFAREMKQQKALKANLVVSTVMSNIGLRRALETMGVRHEMSAVGDRYVLEKMLTCGGSIGGEDSGHLVFLDCHTTGDGILAGLRLAALLKEANKPLSELSQVMAVFPQVLLNVGVKRKPVLEEISKISEIIHKVEQELGDEGRVLVRYSGTQPMCRVMVEGPTMAITEAYCQQIAEVVARELGK